MSANYKTDNRQTYIFEEKSCNQGNQKNYETLMCLGNGYLGMRSAFCEEASSQSRYTLIAGLYDQQPCEVEELMPLPDATVLNISVNGCKINPLIGVKDSYSRNLNVKNGLLTYSYDYLPKDCENVLHIEQKRFVSLHNRHLAAFETVIKADTDAEIAFNSVINARITMDGTQHSFEEERIVLENDILWYAGRAAVAETKYRVSSRMRVYLNGSKVTSIQRYSTARRRIESTAKLHINAGDEVKVVKYVTYYTQNDVEWADKDPDAVKKFIVDEMNVLSDTSFDALLMQSECEWDRRWRRCDISIKSDDPHETLKARLCMYHMIIMCPDHDDRNSVAAKGLTGPGYAGHVFWDCEIFNLPFFVYTNPDAARNLCTYRHRTLDGARRKAKKYGFKGAMYPWESASHKGDEQCPVIGNYSSDNKLRYYTCGDIEHHVVCDVAYGAYNYAKVTADNEFLEKRVLEILFETADFWQSRLEYKPDKDRYEICSCTGPDEYKEYVDNDVFTNYMVEWNLSTALYEIKRIKKDIPSLYENLDAIVNLDELEGNISAKLPKLYLPVANHEGIIPQNDTYLDLEQIDIDKYKNSGINRLIYRDYSLSQISKIMVSKQADLIQLFALMPTLFPFELIRKNFDFYESKCLHDSSLSLSAYAMVAAQIGEAELAHKFFGGAADTDFGANANGSSAGIHAANCGGVWQSIVFGFAGIKACDGVLEISPILPNSWDGLDINLYFRGCELKISVTNDEIAVTVQNNATAKINVKGEIYEVSDKVTVKY